MRSGSWIIVKTGTLDAVIELFSPNLVERVNTDKYDVLTALDYLQRFNASVK